MSSFYLHPKNIHVQNSPIFYCPKPLNNERCQGKFIKTRVRQKECVECMKFHGTIHSHPMYKCITYKKRKKSDILK